MKYAIGNRLNFVQIDTQFSYEFERFLDEYSGINNNQFHKAISIITQIYMTAGNTSGYFLPLEGDADYKRYARQFKIGISDLKALIDVATRTGVFDLEKLRKYNIITNHTLQWCYLTAKIDSVNFQMDTNYILISVMEFAKNNGKYKKIADKLEKLVNKNTSIEQDGIVPKRISTVKNSTADDDDMTLDDFKQKYPEKCLTLPENWVKPEGVKLSVIANAIEKSEKFLKVKQYMTLEKLATKFYDGLSKGKYDDSEYNKMPSEFKPTNTKPKQNYQNREYTPDELNSLFDDVSKVEIKEIL